MWNVKVSNGEAILHPAGICGRNTEDCFALCPIKDHQDCGTT